LKHRSGIVQTSSGAQIWTEMLLNAKIGHIHLRIWSFSGIAEASSGTEGRYLARSWTAEGMLAAGRIACASNMKRVFLLAYYAGRGRQFHRREEKDVGCGRDGRLDVAKKVVTWRCIAFIGPRLPSQAEQSDLQQKAL
jgi:hypothetical protein